MFRWRRRKIRQKSDHSSYNELEFLVENGVVKINYDFSEFADYLMSNYMNKILSIKNKYTRYKKMAVATTHLYLNNEYSDTVWVDYFHDNKSKNDDLADSYLMTRFYISKILNLK